MRVASCAPHPYEVARGVDLEEVVLLRVAGADSDDHGAYMSGCEVASLGTEELTPSRLVWTLCKCRKPSLPRRTAVWLKS
nr:unnamed protein product [Digitaria exilis]